MPMGFGVAASVQIGLGGLQMSQLNKFGRLIRQDILDLGLHLGKAKRFPSSAASFPISSGNRDEKSVSQVS